MRRLPLPLVILAAMFGVAMVWLVMASLVPPGVLTFEPRFAPRRNAQAVDTVTIDGRDADRWGYFAFGRGPLVPPDTAGWDLAVRRFRVIAAGEAARLDTIAFDSLAHAPPDGFVATTFDRDTLNRALARWYRYSLFSHLLHPKQLVYVLRSRAGRYAKLEFLSYYCPGPEPGCVTFRYGLLEP
ncbi:MAG: HmuY family protein [Gemmatimonadales bacterium]